MGRPVLHSTTHLLLTTRPQLPWRRRRHERAPPRAATTPPIWYSAPLSALKVVLLTCTYPDNWERRPVRHNTTHLLLTTRPQLPWRRRRHERAPPRAATTPPISHSTPMSAFKGVLSMCSYPDNWVRRPVRIKTTKRSCSGSQRRVRRFIVPAALRVGGRSDRPAPVIRRQTYMTRQAVRQASSERS